MKDRVSVHPGRVKLTPVAGEQNTYDMLRADSPTQEGTPLNKNTILKDTTAALYGLGTDAVPDEVLGVLGKSALTQISGKYTETTIGEIPTGSKIILNESGKAAEFYIAEQNYESELNGTGRVLIARTRALPDSDKKYFNEKTNEYSGGEGDVFLNSTYKSRLDAHIQTLIGSTTFYYTPGNGNNSVTPLSRAVFMPSGSELGLSTEYMNVEGSALPVASDLANARDDSGTYTASFFTRSPCTSNAITVWYCYGGRIVETASLRNCLLPCFTLPASMKCYVDVYGTVHCEQEYRCVLTDVLGNPLPITAAQIPDGVRIQTGSYIGTGTYGESSPNSLTFEFQPKILFISNAQSGPAALGVGRPGVVGWFPAYKSGAIDNDSNTSTVNITWGDKSISFYSTSSANYQLNYNNYTYYWFIIG